MCVKVAEGTVGGNWRKPTQIVTSGSKQGPGNWEWAKRSKTSQNRHLGGVGQGVLGGTWAPSATLT